MLNPLLILCVDLLASNYSCDTRSGCRLDYTRGSCRCFEGDAFKLWRRMVAEEDGGVIGVFYVVIVYCCTVTWSLVALYFHLVHVHANGRVLDTYQRINDGEDSFFLPHDYEVSLEELNHVIAKAKKWHGPTDQQRRVAVSTYELRDPLVPEFKEISTHVVIYELHLDGSRAVYRHFLRDPQGAITEIFGDVHQTVGAEFAAITRIGPQNGPNPLTSGANRAEAKADHDRDLGPQQLTGYFQGIRTL